jgi:Tol biopolymer transport system component
LKYLINIDGSNEQRSTEIEQEDTEASSSPDRTKIVFISERYNSMGIARNVRSYSKN